MVWWSFAVKGFWALWDNIITVAMVMLLREAYYCTRELRKSLWRTRPGKSRAALLADRKMSCLF
jgi:hypothetical protein